ncbi:MAG TPA: ABC transporter permease [Chitinophagaceae bacterium]|nr:ABC transporter permease [Chitinophagaceae bacterium]
MIKNYIKIGLRNLWKNKSFSFINIFGLSVGFICCLLLAAYVNDELSYDKQPAHASDIYRVELNIENKDFYSSVDNAVGPGMKSAFPEVETFTRFNQWGGIFIKKDDIQYKEPSIAVVDSNFLRFFSIPLLKGNPVTALMEPYSIVLSQSFAKKYFGNSEALGQQLLFNSNPNPYKVTGVIADLSPNLHFNFGIFVSKNERQMTWSNLGDYTYLRLKPGSDPAHLESQFPQLVAKYVVPEVQRDMGISLSEAQKSVNTFRFILKPLSRIHLYSDNKDELAANGSIKYVYIFSALALFILLLACVNFTNLSTAFSTKRSKEVGIRKVMGSGKHELMIQFLLESILLAFFAYLFSLIFVYLLLPYFNELAGKQIVFSFFFHPVVLLSSLLVVVIAGVLSGIYPSVFLASFNIIQVLKSGSAMKVGSSRGLRTGLIVFQFFVSTVLIASTIVVYRQLHFMQSKKLGFDTEQVLVLNDTHLIGGSQEVFKEEMLKDPRVTGVTLSRDVPVASQSMDGTQAFIKEKSEKTTNPEIHINKYHVDYDYVSTLGMQMVGGRNFSKDFPSDSAAMVINETAARDFGFQGTDPLGAHVITSGQHEFKIIGVVKDFHYASIKQKIAPLVMMLDQRGGGMLVKVKTAAIEPFLKNVKGLWGRYNARGPLTYSFLEERFANVYASERRTGQIFTLFAFISILIAAMGLFGLSAFTTRQRTKEIGVRKVLGASVPQVMVLLSKEFVYMVIAAFVLAVPVTWFAMHKWLEEFAYRIPIGTSIFFLAGGIALVIAIITVSLQAMRAALANPIRSLRSE